MAKYVLNSSFNSPCGLNSVVYQNEGSEINRLIEDPTVKKDIKFDELSIFYKLPSNVIVKVNKNLATENLKSLVV